MNTPNLSAARPLTPRALRRLARFASLGLCLAGCDQQQDHPERGAGPHDEAAHAHGEPDAHGHDGHADEVRLTAEAVERYGIATAEAQLWLLRPTFTAPARVAFNSEAMAHVGSPLRGRAVEILARVGDQVNKDAPLVVIESPELGQAQSEFLQKRTAAQSAGPQTELAKTAWDRARGLLENSGGISLTDVQRREAEYKAAVAAQKSAEAAATAAENILHLLGMDQPSIEQLASTGEIAPRYTVRAAIDGQVVQREITMGELVGPDRESLMILADVSTLWVLAEVPEPRLPLVMPGATAWVTVGPGLPGGRPAAYEGRVAFISPLVDPTTRTAEVRVELPRRATGADALRPGMFAQVEIVAADPDAEEPTPRIAVPESAIQTVEGGPAVFVPVRDEPNTFALRPLTVGRPVGGLVPVIAGLVEGERFVTEGSFILKAELGKGSAGHEH